MVPRLFTFAATSDTGKVRDQNEDGILSCGRFVRDGSASDRVASGGETLLFAVADGVGGAPAGEVASEFVLHDLGRRFETLAGVAPVDREHAIASCCHDTDASLRSVARRDPARMGMATTCTGVVVVADAAYWFNAGDSRLYRARAGRLEQISTDHTLREEMQNPAIPGNIITNCFGMEGFRVDVEPIELAERDLLLLCSDGLSDYADAANLEAALLGYAGSNSTGAGLGDVEALAAQLLSLALEGGGGDNISLLLVEPADA
jgi:protein phosphatase